MPFAPKEASKRLDHVIYGDCFDVDCRAESVSLLLLNPPYQEASRDDGPSQRLEELFLQRTHRWLRPSGVLILVVPVTQLAVCGNILSRYFKDTEIYRMTESASAEYKQIVIFGVRRSRRERERLQHREITALRLEYGRKSRNFEVLPPLPDHPQRVYIVPEAEPLELIHHGLLLDDIEELLPRSPAYRQAQRILFAPQACERGRPLSPLHQGHVGLLACAGALDGVFADGDLRHISRWQAVKRIHETHDEDEKGIITIRQREEFSHCLNLLYADGEIAVLTADAPAAEQNPAAEEAVPARARVPVESTAHPSRKFRIEEGS